MYTGPDEVHNQTCTLAPSLNWTETAAVGVGALTQRKTIYVHDSNLFIRLYISWFQSIYMIYISWYHTSYHTNIMGLTCNTNTLVYTLLPSANKLKWFFCKLPARKIFFVWNFSASSESAKVLFLEKCARINRCLYWTQRRGICFQFHQKERIQAVCINGPHTEGDFTNQRNVELDDSDLRQTLNPEQTLNRQTLNLEQTLNQEQTSKEILHRETLKPEQSYSIAPQRKVTFGHWCSHCCRAST